MNDAYDKLVVPLDKWNSLKINDVIQHYITCETADNIFQTLTPNFFIMHLTLIHDYVPKSAFNQSQLDYIKYWPDYYPLDTPLKKDPLISTQGKNTWNEINKELEQIDSNPIIRKKFNSFVRKLPDKNIWRNVKEFKNHLKNRYS